MTKTSPTATQDSSTPPRSHPIRSFLVLVFRLLLLGIGGGFAALIGVAIAQFYPASSPEEPILSQVMRTSTRWFDRLDGSADPQPVGTAPVNPDVPVSVATTLETLTFTLPSDVLFVENTTRLNTNANLILNTITTELQRYPGAVVRVAAHTHAESDPATDSPVASRDRSLAQAQAVGTYLANTLGDRYHWVTVGYGSTQPLVPNDSPTNQQRNRRIEITVEP